MLQHIRTFAFLAALIAPVFANAQSAPTSIYVEKWASLDSSNGNVERTAGDPEAVCKLVNDPGPIATNAYKAQFFKRVSPVANSSASPGDQLACVSLCENNAACPPSPQEGRHPAFLVCMKRDTTTGVETKVQNGRCPCEVGCNEGITINNPVELPGRSKVVRDTDWAAPNEPSFAIERIYRSDSLLAREFETAITGERNTLGGVWRFAFDFWQDTGKKNPYDAADTRNFVKLMFGNGRSIHFLQSNMTVKLGFGMGYTHSTPGPSFSNFNDGRGVVRQFTLFGSAPHPLGSISWPDGYKITIARSGALGNRLFRMTDNRGNEAEFIYDQNVVPGANRPLVKEVLLSRTVAGVKTTFGKIIYTYQPSSYTGPGSPILVPGRPVITAVDHLDLITNTTTPIRRYSYNPGGPGELAWPPLLTSISDGSVDGSGNSVAFAEYSYAWQPGLSSSGGDIGSSGLRSPYPVATTRHAGDAEPTEYARVPLTDTYTVENPKGLTTTYGFDDVGYELRLETLDTEGTANALATAVTQTYDANGLVIERNERNGSRTTYVRDARGLITTMTEDATGAAPRVTTYTWHATFRLPLTRVTPGLTETFTYDANALLLTYSQTDTKAGSPTNGQVRTWAYGYTTLSGGLKVLTTVNGPGLPAEGVTDITTYAYTAAGDLASATDAVGLVTTVIARNTYGQPTVLEQPDKSRWTFAYDWKGRVISAGFAGPGLTPATSTFVYNFSDQIVSLTNSRGKTWTFSYNAARRLTGSTSPTGDRATYFYDLAGNISRTEYRKGTSPVAFWEEAQFDDLSRVLKLIGAMGQYRDFAHDREDNLVSDTDTLNHATTYSYDALNRLISTVDRGSFTTGMEYDAHDRLTEYTDPRMIETDFTYNGFGEVTTEVSADRGTTTYAYERRGLVRTRTDGRGITVTYSYDNAGRLTLIDYPAGGIGDIAFTWDAPFLGVPADSNKGKVGSINDGTIQLDFGHQVLASGPRVSVTARYPGNRNYIVRETTDFEGNATRTVYPSGNEVLIDYDDDNRPSRIRFKVGTVFTTLLDQMTYAPNGPMLSALYGDGRTQTRTYDLSYRLTRIEDRLGAARLRDVTYGYEGRDNITSITDALAPANSETFGYTPREHLASGSGPYGVLGYTYDGVGNRLTSKLGTATDTYAYPPTSNRLGTITLAAGGTRGFTYDAAGNVTAEARTGGPYGYTYNAAGRMAEFRINGVLQASYKYDAMGRQAIRTLISPTAITIHSIFDSQGRRIAEYNETSGALIREYVWNGWDPIAVIEGGVISYVRADHIGRPVFATNATGVKTWTATYTPFGGVHTSTGAPPSARFPGQWFQSESGLHQNWMRDYDPTTGRYLQADPLGLVDGASVYGYAGQSPMRLTDPTGEFIPQAAACLANPWCRAAAGAAAAAAANLVYQLWIEDCELREVNWWEVTEFALYGAAAAAPHYWWSSQARGGGARLYRNGPGVDFHKFGIKGVVKHRLHYHAGKNSSQMGKHRPWQGGWRPWKW